MSTGLPEPLAAKDLKADKIGLYPVHLNNINQLKEEILAFFVTKFPRGRYEKLERYELFYRFPK